MKMKGLYYELVRSQASVASTFNSIGVNLESVFKSTADQENISSTRTKVVGENEEIETRTPVRSFQNSANSNLDPNSVKVNEEVSEWALWKIFLLNKPERAYILFGVLGSIIVGLSTPAYAMVFGEIMGLFDQSLEDLHRWNDILALV